MKGGCSQKERKARFRRFLCLFLLVFSLPAILAAAAMSSEDLPALLAKAKMDGSVRVIVALKSPKVAAAAATEALAPETPQAQKTAITAAQDSVLRSLEKYEVKDIKRFDLSPYLSLEVDAAALQALASLPQVEAVGRDIIFYPSLMQSAAVVGALQAWNLGVTGAGQTIAVIDSGVDKFHPFLRGKIVSEACYSTTYPPDSAVNICSGGVPFVGNDAGLNCSSTIQGCDHGTHVAGIAAGKGLSFSGIAKDAAIIAIQAGSRFDSPAICPNYVTPCVAFYFSDVYSGLERVLALHQSTGLKIAAVNLSLGGTDLYNAFCDNRTIYTQALKSAVDRLRAVGIATIVASGNNGQISMSVPACLSNVVSVGSSTDGTGTQQMDQVSSFSNCNVNLNLLAPGESIVSSVPGISYAAMRGTSMAAPHVAAAWALLKAKKPTATFDEILSALTSTGLDLLTSCNVYVPRIQVDMALRAIDYVPGTVISSTTTTTTVFPSTTLTGTPSIQAYPSWCQIPIGQTACGVTLQIYNPGNRPVQLWARSPSYQETPVTGIFNTNYFSVAVPWIMEGNYLFSLYDMSTINRILVASTVVTGVAPSPSTTYYGTTTTIWMPTTTLWIPTTTIWLPTTTSPVTTTTLPPSDLVLNVSCPRVTPGTEVVVPISLASIVQGQGGAVSVQADLSFDPGQLTYIGVSKGPSAYNAFKEIGVGVQYPGRLRFLVSGQNQNVLGDGILMYLTFSVTAGIPSGTNISLICSDSKAYNFMGQPIPIGCASCSLPTEITRRTLQ